jgi:hypothetical protein
MSKKEYRVHTESFNLKQLNEIEGKEQYRVEISNRFAVLENLDGKTDITSNRALKTIRENIKISTRDSVL